MGVDRYFMLLESIESGNLEMAQKAPASHGEWSALSSCHHSPDSDRPTEKTKV